MRKPRLLREGAKYHVTARANRQELIFAADGMKELFRAVLNEAKRKFRFRLDNFSILGNHFHLIIQPRTATSLSGIMQWIMSVYAQRWNRHHGLRGHVWGERFFSRVIGSFADFISTLLYIDLNPVRAGFVDSPEQWAFGGAYWRGQRQQELVDPLENSGMGL